MVRLHLPTRGCRQLGAVASVLFGLASAALASAQEQFPYVAYVVHDDAYVRSGPGQRYYPTQQLPHGFAVEVYRHDNDGWCAIRPPEGSFSWAPAHEMRIVQDGVAEVIAERVVTRVGSTLSPTRTAVQVLLERGERVALVPGDSADPNWLRVVAPAGEFRWIAARDLGRQAPLEVNPPTPTTNAWSSPKVAGAPVQNISTPAAAPTSSEPNAFDHLLQTNATPTAPSPLANQDASRVDIVAGSPAELQLAQFQGQSGNLAAPGLIHPASSTAPSAVTSPRVRFEGVTPPARTYTAVEIPERLREMELQLSQIVVEPPQQWQFDSLQGEANAMLIQAQDAQVQAQLRDFLGRVTRFQQVRDGYSQFGQPNSQAGQSVEQFSNAPVPDLGPPVDPVGELVQNVRQRVREDFAEPREESVGSSIDEPLYDAVGLLKPVVSRRNGAPQYALVDGKGDVVSFVTPTPDLNLKPYIGRRIGVNGSRGFMTDFRRAHVTAGRVTPVDAPLRR
jgi:uncharacterized protein YraI